MIYQPRNVYPYLRALDMSMSQTFSVTLQTNGSVVAYELIIANSASSDIYNSGRITLSKPLFNEDTLYVPIDPSGSHITNGSTYKWRLRLYQDIANMIITHGLVTKNNTASQVYLQKNIRVVPGMSVKIGAESRVISSYDVSTGLAVLKSGFSSSPTAGTRYQVLSDFIETTPEYLFYASAEPKLTLTQFSAAITTRKYTFKCKYEQADNIPMTYYVYRLWRFESDTDTTWLEDETLPIYSAELTYTYDRLISGERYMLECAVMNELGVEQSIMREFSVNYTELEYEQKPTVKFNKGTNAMDVSWVAPVSHDGVVYNTSGVTGHIVNQYAGWASYLEPSQQIYKDNKIIVVAKQPGLNIVPNKNDSKVVSGIHFNILPDKSIQVTGMSTSEVLFQINSNGTSVVQDIELKKGVTYAIYPPAHYEATKIKTCVKYGNTIIESSNAPVTFTPNTNVRCGVYLKLPANITYDEYVAPMVYLNAYESNVSYEPFRPLGTQYYGFIDSYDASNGFATFKNKLFREESSASSLDYMPMSGDLYMVISNTPKSPQYLLNTPYQGVNSLYTKGYEAVWEGPQGISENPNRFNITFQFNVGREFFFDADGTYRERVPLVSGDSKEFEKGSFSIEIYKNMLEFHRDDDITLRAPFYSDIQEAFVLEDGPNPLKTKIYQWDDTATWDDTKYWVEGTSYIDRIINRWWRVQITNNKIVIQEGIAEEAKSNATTIN